ncbi:PREDICTED: forkhead box protein N1 isoform X1 [Gekko japonicus]|uniref:Forkhead box protein N1 isoform X1 n=1 Tax=Gekko japonicus TaxID=146911 RepID=A0ABM1KUH8_GEKJA|nr:PREDICTED: forkhead box protein N1 isoform X1 [Gekko japonicus]
MVSLLQDQSNIKFPSSDPLENDQHSDLMQTHEDSSSPVQEENPGFCGQPYDGENSTERTNSESSQSPSPSSSPSDHVYRRGIHTEKDVFKVPSAAEKFRRYSYEENTLGTCGRFLKNSARNPFHPYKRQFAEEAFPETHQAPPMDKHPFKLAIMDGFEEMAGPTVAGEAEVYITHVPSLSSEPPWCNAQQYNNPGQEHHSQGMQDPEVKLKTSPLEGQPSLYCYQPQVPQMYCPSHPFPQYPTGGSYPVTYISASHYPYQRIAPQSNQEHQQPLFPKPIYSYSILIFMALKNSKTGSLPVSEIYNFMTEHFPYFKTAPDGWKNSVRHNLSLNKCFEKVENKSGSSSRKGCLWALNPAKIDKMQEELQKWKRKDPMAVRKSMAKPEELDTLIGGKSEKLRSPLAGCSPAPPVPGHMPLQHPSLCEPPISAAQPVHALPRQGSAPAKSPLPNVLRGQQTFCYRAAPGFAPVSPSFVQQLPDSPQALLPPADAQGEQRVLSGTVHEPPLPAQPPPGRAVKEHAAARTEHDLFLPEGDLSNDVDALNPSLTDFDFQGNLWEELKDDSLAVDPLVLVSSPLTSTPCCSSQGLMDSSHGFNSHSMPDVQLTTLYSAFMELDTGSPSSYLNNPGSKAVALV